VTCFTEFNLFQLKIISSKIVLQLLCDSCLLMLIVSPAYSRLNNFPEHFDARKGTRVIYWFGVAYHTQGSRSQEHAGHFVSAGEHQRTRHFFLLPPSLSLSLSLSLSRKREKGREKESSYNLLFTSTDFNTIGNLGIHASLLSYLFASSHSAVMVHVSSTKARN